MTWFFFALIWENQVGKKQIKNSYRFPFIEKAPYAKL